MTRKSGGLAIALAVAVGLAASPLAAQRGQGRMGREAGPNMGRSLTVILEHQEDLDLTGDQVKDLQGLASTMEKDVTPLAEEMKALREQIREGDMDREDGFRQMQALRGKFMTASAPLRGRVEEILTVEQHRKVQGIMWQDRPGAGRGGPAFQGRGRSMGRRGKMAVRGRGMRDGRPPMAARGRGRMVPPGRGGGMVGPGGEPSQGWPLR